MPDYQRVRVRWDNFVGLWRWDCPACGGYGGWEWAGVNVDAREHYGTCPALRLNRLLSDLEAEARTAESLAVSSSREAAGFYRNYPERAYWDAWHNAHSGYATTLTTLAAHYREAPDA